MGGILVFLFFIGDGFSLYFCLFFCCYIKNYIKSRIKRLVRIIIKKSKWINYSSWRRKFKILEIIVYRIG